MSKMNKQCANAIRALSMDAVQKANSGHPGAPMGMAEMATALWGLNLSHNPNNPHWINRDRFILSNGHASMLLYSLLHLTGYALSIDDLKDFRQLNAKTAGHPEYGFADGIETTTGPLGQGIANAVGMALAEKMMAGTYNTEKHTIIDHYTYTFLGDGCMMEGISHEACSLAGTLKLNKLIALYDDNGISIDGDIRGWFTDNTKERFLSYGWNVIGQIDGHDIAAVDAAIKEAKKSDKPTLIICKTLIGKGSPNKEGSEATHGAPLGADEIAATKASLGWNYGPFEVPEEIYQAWDARTAGDQREEEWNSRFDAYVADHPEKADELLRRIAGELPDNFEEIFAAALKSVNEKEENIATRVASKNALDLLATNLAEIVGGSADLTPSNNTFFKGSRDLDITTGEGNYIRFGVREFGMAAIMNGLALYGGFIPYGATFLVFSDYARNAIRMSALMEQRVVYIMTHDSIGLGEDGPTHQPVEHVESLRLIPNLYVWRPCDAVETLVAWADGLKAEDHPTLLALSRQNLPHQTRDAKCLEEIARGGYTLLENPAAEITLLATGSEVELAMEAAKELNARVVSMPCVERFREQDEAYKVAVLGEKKILAIEAGVTRGWYEFADAVLGIDTFGASAPAKDLFPHFGFTVDNVIQKAQALLAKA
ncbi:transketolase [Ignatzschineria cameli]|uniref:Transketolase n=4 Tax=Bacteria TaxID=2 RepID=A0A2U2AKI2_9GAMM|nr:transketolase [Ignatzschineria cameli]PWD83344.1 transketolase [Ignatzschineria cameli]PWD85700.1 transketolase [Ignatzschineria cameli]PWD88370.1 transketolase [Ignatzschineria cameli]PWD88829.1 transketolase [Ignatzschineria cameli]PWD89336.1 transketolase [Ignatzschineria cameli]